MDIKARARKFAMELHTTSLSNDVCNLMREFEEVRTEATYAANEAMWTKIASAIDDIAPSNWGRSSVIRAIEGAKPTVAQTAPDAPIERFDDDTRDGTGK